MSEKPLPEGAIVIGNVEVPADKQNWIKFVRKTGQVVMMPPGGKKLSPEEKAKREAERKKAREERKKRRAKLRSEMYDAKKRLSQRNPSESDFRKYKEAREAYDKEMGLLK